MPCFSKGRVFLFILLVTIVLAAFQEAGAKGKVDSGFTGLLYLGIPYSYNRVDEFYQSNNYDHRGIGVGAAIGLRVGIQIGRVGFGGTGELNVLGYAVNRENLHTGMTSGAYSNSVEEQLGGGFISLRPFDDSYTLFEYYGHARGFYKWSEDKNENIFQKGNQLQGTGWGIGLGKIAGDILHVVIIYREVKYKLGDFKDESFSLPSDRYSEVWQRSVSIQAGLGF